MDNMRGKARTYPSSAPVLGQEDAPALDARPSFDALNVFTLAHTQPAGSRASLPWCSGKLRPCLLIQN